MPTTLWAAARRTSPRPANGSPGELEAAAPVLAPQPAKTGLADARWIRWPGGTTATARRPSIVLLPPRRATIVIPYVPGASGLPWKRPRKRTRLTPLPRLTTFRPARPQLGLGPRTSSTTVAGADRWNVIVVPRCPGPRVWKRVRETCAAAALRDDGCDADEGTGPGAARRSGRARCSGRDNAVGGVEPCRTGAPGGNGGAGGSAGGGGAGGSGGGGRGGTGGGGGSGAVVTGNEIGQGRRRQGRQNVAARGAECERRPEARDGNQHEEQDDAWTLPARRDNGREPETVTAGSGGVPAAEGSSSARSASARAISASAGR